MSELRRIRNSEDKNPYNRRSEKITNRAFQSVAKSVRPVAKDTNKTRRKMVKPTMHKDKS